MTNSAGDEKNKTEFELPTDVLAEYGELSRITGQPVERLIRASLMMLDHAQKGKAEGQTLAVVNDSTKLSAELDPLNNLSKFYQNVQEHDAVRTARLERERKDHDAQIEIDKKNGDWERTKEKILFITGIGVSFILIFICILLMVMDLLGIVSVNDNAQKAIFSILTGLLGTFIGYVLKK